MPTESARRLSADSAGVRQPTQRKTKKTSHLPDRTNCRYLDRTIHLRLLLLNGLLAANLDPQAPLVEYPPLWHVAHGFRHALAFHVVRASNAVPILARFLDTKCGATRRDWVFLYQYQRH